MKVKAALYVILGALVGVVAGWTGLDILIDLMVRRRKKWTTGYLPQQSPSWNISPSRSSPTC